MTCQVLTIAQQKGGAGKTTVTAHLAVAYSQQGKRVAVIDIDPQGSLTHWHSLRTQRFGEGYTGLNFSSLSGWRLGTEIARLKKHHDIILIDSPPHTETEAKTAIRQADAILLPVQPSPTDVWATRATIELAEKEKLPVHILFNRVAPNSKLLQQLKDELPQTLTSTLGNRVPFASCLLEGRTVTETAPGSAAAQEVKILAAEVAAKLWPTQTQDEEAA